ncbi:MAG: hypothetical protein LBE13_00795 [Bacteroidales bacterium]|jgi:hypothetical protein|nr:hypothetical protein [Bacteroidales bacterium]
MKWLKKIKRVFYTAIASKNKITPIIFNNSPIKNEKDDIFDFSSQADMLNAAIKNGANIIGIIGDYGSGKSTLTEISQKKFGIKYRVIRVNLWDSINETITEKQGNGSEANNLNLLLRSFLYQFALGNERKNSSYAHYINERQSKNYGKLSVTMSSKRALWWFFLAGLCYAVFFSFTSAEIFTAISELSKNKKYLSLLNILQAFSYFILLVAVALTYRGIKVGAFVFSLWDSQGKILPEARDIFDNYTRIVNRIMKRLSRKQLVFIEDLDRMENKNLVIPFLKELYRFNNLLPAWQREKLVFLVSLKSESTLKNVLTKQIEEPSVYSKIFDYTLWIKPIHKETIPDAVIHLLESKKEQLIKALDIKDNVLSRDILTHIEWLIAGENLTLREIKDRLNEAFNLYQTLKMRNFSSSSVSLKKCCAVVYLHRVYQTEYENLLSKETKLAAIIRECYFYQNDDKKKIDEIVLAMMQHGEENTSSSDIDKTKFCNDLTAMVFSSDIDDDFLMYFYSYPKNSYIKNIDEKEISDYILHHTNDYKADKALNEKLKRVIEEKEGVAIKEAVSELLSKDREIPLMVLDNEHLFSFVYTHNKSDILTKISQVSGGIIETPRATSEIIGKILAFDFDQREKVEITKNILPKILNVLSADVTESDIINVRLCLIENTKNYIIHFIELFVSEKLPIISENELNRLKTNNEILCLINPNLINEENSIFIFEKINSLPLNDQEYVLAEKLLLNTPNLNSLENIQLMIITFLLKNKRYNKKLFGVFVGSKSYDYNEIEDELCEYLQIIDISLLEDNLLKTADGFELEKITDEKVLRHFENKGLYISSLLSRAEMNSLALFDFKANGVVDKLVELGVIIYTNHPEKFLKIRYEALKQLIETDSALCKLFMPNYPLITEPELDLIDDPEDKLYDYIWHDSINEKNYSLVSNYCNKKAFVNNKLFYFFKSLFEKKEKGVESYISDIKIVRCILSDIDFSNIKFNSMNENQQNEVCEILGETYQIKTAAGAFDFMKTVMCLIPSFEKAFESEILGDVALSDQYIDLVNSLKRPTKETLNIFKSIKINKSLVPEITDWLYVNKNYIRYIAGKSLYDKKILSDETMDLKYYYSAFTMSENFAGLCCAETDWLFKFAKRNLLDNGMPNKYLLYFYKIRQSIFLIKFILQRLGTDIDGIKTYLHSITHIDSENDANEFINVITDAKYVVILQEKELFYCIHRLMWNPIQKQRLTRKTNIILGTSYNAPEGKNYGSE